ncbi:hypothetical protein AC1031_009366 [Aphanomyces cochlioides]|nr:hypothetical protein AC1031_009366 [Aphanomyces cochlioides]
MNLHLVAAAVLSQFVVSASTSRTNGFGAADHVILMGLDGLDVRCLHQALDAGRAPNLQYLRDHGIFTDKARNNRPTMSLPNWATIFYGAGVMFHGVTSNEWTYCTTTDVNVIPQFLGECSVYPDVFTVLKQQNPDFTTAMYYTWPNLDAILPPDVVSIDQRYFVDGAGCQSTVRASQDMTTKALASISSLPSFMFLYYDEVDECAHETSCFLDEGQAAIASMDANIGLVLEAVRAAGKANSTVFMLVTDHGRNVDGNDHGGTAKFNFETQWLVYSPGLIDGGRQLKSAIATEDTAPTIAHLLGVETPIEWRGRMVREVMLKRNESLYSAARSSAWATCSKSQCPPTPLLPSWAWPTALILIASVLVVAGTIFAFHWLCSRRRDYVPV